MPLRALIFDFDGTILDTETPEVQAWQKIFRDHGAEYPDEYWMHAIGRGADQIDKTPIELLAELTGQEIARWNVLMEYEQLRMSAIEALDCRPGIRDLIELAKSRGLGLGVASSSHHVWVDRHLKRLGLYDSFPVIVCADDVPRAKPFPDLYLSACEQLGADPADAAAIEDSPNGIRAARDAGLRVVAIPNSCTIRLNLGEAGLVLDSAALLTLEMIEALPVGVPWVEPETVAPDSASEIQRQFAAIVEEMKAVGIWEIEQPSEEAFANMGAFGLNTMALEQWLRWVFVPTIEERLASGGPWPQSSSVGTVALRNFDGITEYDNLVRLLNEFDRLF